MGKNNNFEAKNRRLTPINADNTTILLEPRAKGLVKKIYQVLGIELYIIGRPIFGFIFNHSRFSAVENLAVLF